MPPDQILQRGRREKIFLAQPQFLPRRRRVRGVKHLRNRLSLHPPGLRAGMVTLVEQIQPQFIPRPGGPQPQRVHPLGPPAHHRRVIGGGDHDLLRLPRIRPAMGAHRAAKPDLVLHLRPFKLPRVAKAQPVLRLLLLHAVGNDLPEQPVFVANAVTIARDPQCRQTLHKARRQPPQPAIAECCIRLQRPQILQIHIQPRQRLAHRPHDVQIVQIIEQQPPDQKLQRQIIHPLLPLPLRRLQALQPRLHREIPHHDGGRQQPVPLGENRRAQSLRRTIRPRTGRCLSAGRAARRAGAVFAVHCRCLPKPL